MFANGQRSRMGRNKDIKDLSEVLLDLVAVVLHTVEDKGKLAQYLLICIL